jgi:hypothetical protein
MGLLKKLGLKKKKKDATTLVTMGCAQSKTTAAVVVGGAASLSGESNAKRDVSFSKSECVSMVLMCGLFVSCTAMIDR